MKSLFTPLAIALLGLSSLGGAACGGADKDVGSASRAASSTAPASVPAVTASSVTSIQRSMTRDRDNDYDNKSKSRYDRDDNVVLHYGHVASAADKRVIAALVERYYAAAAAGDGAKACPLIFSLLAESVPEDYGQPPGPPSLRGKTCAVVMSKLFKQRHQELAVDAATFEVTGVRVDGKRGLALLSFGSVRDRNIPVHREFGVWKIGDLVDSGSP
jgi:hypothetical protein